MTSGGVDPKIIFLDFDGVVILSNEIKDSAFTAVFERFLVGESQAKRRECEAFHLAHNALTRRQKFEHIVYRILKRDEPMLVEAMVTAFSELTEQALVDCPYGEGAIDFLKFWRSRLALMIVSATPQTDLDRTVDARGLRVYFTKVAGAVGSSKSDVMRRELLAKAIAPEQALFVGDSPEDLSSARDAGVPFAGIIGRSSFTGEDVPCFPHLGAVHRWLLTATGAANG